MKGGCGSHSLCCAVLLCCGHSKCIRPIDEASKVFDIPKLGISAWVLTTWAMPPSQAGCGWHSVLCWWDSMLSLDNSVVLLYCADHMGHHDVNYTSRVRWLQCVALLPWMCCHRVCL